MPGISLKSLGWNSYFENNLNEFSKDHSAGRISAEHKNHYKILTEYGEVIGRIVGKLHQQKQYPVVGDWVKVSIRKEENKASIHSILPRKTKVSRKTAEKNVTEQVIVANVDTIFIVTSFGRDFNLRRLERYLTIVGISGAQPVIILNKADQSNDIAEKISQIETITKDIPIHIISALHSKGLGQLREYLTVGKTIALLGSSGVGKSTLINALMGEKRQITKSLRRDGKGRHTTSYRELILLDEGGIIIDNPGMREIQILGSKGLDNTFTDIANLASQCKFRNCQHQTEPNCAIKKAIKEGKLSKDRLDNYIKLQRESRYSDLKEKLPTERAVEKAKWDQIISNANSADGYDHIERANFKRKMREGE